MTARNRSDNVQVAGKEASVLSRQEGRFSSTISSSKTLFAWSKHKMIYSHQYQRMLTILCSNAPVKGLICVILPSLFLKQNDKKVLFFWAIISSDWLVFLFSCFVSELIFYIHTLEWRKKFFYVRHCKKSRVLKLK